MNLLQVPLRADMLKVEPSGAKVEGERVKRENAENMLAEERDGMEIWTVYVLMCIYCVCVNVHVRLC